MKKVLLIYPNYQTFVREDDAILSSFCEVSHLHIPLPKNAFKFFYYQLKAILYLLFKGWKYDVLYIWFCDYHAFTVVLMNKILRKKTMIVVGGFDAVSVPKIKYGLFYKNNLRAKMAKFAYRNCDWILPVDESLVQSKNSFAGEDSKTGVLEFVPEVADKIKVIPTGYDPEKWKCQDEKKRQVLTIALINNEKIFYRKGIDVFVQCASQLTDYEFVLAGLQDVNLLTKKEQNLSNLTIYPILAQEELMELYSTSKVYAQFSLSEGLPNVLCEAMLCECIPVGSSANGIPKAIGKTGFVIEKPEEAIKAIQKAMKKENGLEARERIITLFQKNKRLEQLKSLL